jgi:hypothetical protein
MDEEKRQIRAWLYELLASVEMADEVKGTRVNNGNSVTVKITMTRK